MSQILSLTVPAASEPPETDALRIAAYDEAVRAGESGVCLVLVQMPSGTTVRAVVNVSAASASMELPLPQGEEDLGWAYRFVFPTGVYLVTELPAAQAAEKASAAFPAAERLFVLPLNRETAYFEATKLDWISGAALPVRRTAEGAAAAALYLHRDLENGTMEVTVGQPGGVLEIGLRKEQGRVLGLSAGGPVKEASA